jgi:hypothetical protein
MAAAMHVSLHMFGIDVADLQAECFALAQPGRTHGPAVGSIARLPDGGDESMHSTSGNVFCLGIRSLVRAFPSRGAVYLKKNFSPL